MAVKRYDGSAWQVVAGKGDQGTSSSISTWVKTASGGETSLSGNDDNSQSLSYTVGQELVFINGTLLKRGSDYTATNGTSITGLTALAANDVATVWTVNAFSVANTYTQAQVDNAFVNNSKYFAAGKNKVINGDFNINQRGFTSLTANESYGFDRWLITVIGDGTTTYSAQTFTLGAAPVTGYESKNFARLVTTGQTATNAASILLQRIESVRTFAAETVTLSFWAKSGSGTPKIALEFQQFFGSGGSPSASVNTYANQVTISNTWTRYTTTVSIPSISGKTLGTSGDHLGVRFWVSAGTDYNARTGSLGIQSNTFDIWGVQLEAGSVATAFQTATGTLAGELAACQRYYFRQGGQTLYQRMANGAFNSTTNAFIQMPHPVTMRIAPTSVDYSTMALNDYTSTVAITSISIDYAGGSMTSLSCAVASGGTQYRPVQLLTNNSTSAYVGLSAEL